jgi:predicted kinase
MLIVMTGLPATGKTTLAGKLAAEIDAVIVSKDDLREAAFPPSVRDYSSAQNDLCMEMVYHAVDYIIRRWPGKNVIIDGRTYRRKPQVERLVEFAGSLAIEPEFIECMCSDDVARRRLEGAASGHAAADRDVARYLALKAHSDALELCRLTLDTGSVDVKAAVRLCVAYLTDQV